MTSKLTDEQLLRIALSQEPVTEQEVIFEHDVVKYQRDFNLVDGDFQAPLEHLYFHYFNWSKQPVSLSEFKKNISLNRKGFIYFYVDKDKCNIDFYKLLGDYVKFKKKGY